MNKITFSKDRYHLHGEMEQWCRANIGTGSWCYSYSDNWQGTEDMWRIAITFGNTTFSFRESISLTWFLLRWL